MGTDVDVGAGQTLADVVVDLAGDVEDQAPGPEGAEALTGDAFQLQLQAALRTLWAELANDGRGDSSARRALGVVQRIGQFQRLAALKEGGGVLQHQGVDAVGHRAADLIGPAARTVDVDLHQQRIEVQVVQVRTAAPRLTQQVGAADDLINGAGADGGQDFADLLGDEGEEVDHLLRRAGELGAQALVLRADADRAGVGMALTHHQTAHGDQA